MGRCVLTEGKPNMSQPEQATPTEPTKKSGNKRSPLWWGILGLLVVVLLVVIFVI